ncbi:MAG TPA: hypothetical protein VN368_01575 [Candidatus Methylomirabilis sp.]|nr:hypothetical protein [Candidatus Methylomirabilis sp.]
MPKMINLIPECYEQLEKIKEEIKKQKADAGKQGKTTFSETVCCLIRNYRKSHSIECDGD